MGQSQSKAKKLLYNDFCPYGPTMKKALFLLLFLISLVILTVRFGDAGIKKIIGSYEKSGINVLSIPEGAQVFLDNKEVGETPFENQDFISREYILKIQKDKLTWEGKVNLNAGTITVINRELALDIASSAGEILTMEKGKGVTVVSNPGGADVEVDGKNIGKTPITLNIDSGEHTFNISRTNYLKRSIRARLQQGYNLTINTDLALSEADLSTIAAPVITATPQLLVKNTPTGFLRVRDKGSLNSKEIAQVKPGDSLILLEELGNWDRVRLSDGTEGFVSAAYVEKKAGSP